MQKQAGVSNVGVEEASRVKNQFLTRSDKKAAADVLFQNAKAARDLDRKVIDRLFLQAGGAETRAMLTKEAMAVNVTHFFEKKAYLSEAQRRFPELLKVADSGEPKKTVLAPVKGAKPVQSLLTGGDR